MKLSIIRAVSRQTSWAVPRRTSRGFFRNRLLQIIITTTGLTIAATQKMHGQINPDFAAGKYNTIETVVDYNGPASDIEAQYHANDASTQYSWSQSVETECLNPETHVNGNANVPASVIAGGNLGITGANYDDYVRGIGAYAGNGRPNSSDDRRGYVYQLQVNMDAYGATLGNGTSYSTSVYDAHVISTSIPDIITHTHETGHQLGLFHSDATTFSMEVDYQQNGSYGYTETAKSVMSDGQLSGHYTQLMTCSANNRTDIAPDGYVYDSYIGYPARTLPANLDNSSSGDRSLDKLHDRLMIGGIIHDRVKEREVPANQKIENIPFNYSINGTVLTVQNFAGFDALTNPNNGLPEDCQVFIYNANDTAEGHQIARFPAPRSNRIGWRWDSNGQIDFANFLAQHGGNLSDYAFRIRATHQNQMGPVGVEQVNTPPETYNNTVSVNEDTPYHFQASDFQYSDNDNDPMTAIKATSLPAHGTLQLNGTAVTANQVIATSDIANLTFTPDANWNGQTSFQFSASDGTAWSTPDTMTINVNAVNDAPSAPANLTASVSGNQVDLSFDPATDVDGTIDHYNIYVDGTLLTNTTSTTPSITITNDGQHNIEVSAVDNEGLEGALSTAVTVNTLGIEDQKIAGLKMYPNPANNTLNIEIDGQLDDIEIYNLQGQLIREFDPQGVSKYPANIQGLSQGVYLVDIWNKQGQKSVQKLIVE